VTASRGGHAGILRDPIEKVDRGIGSLLFFGLSNGKS
jgi:hypothetical protein